MRAAGTTAASSYDQTACTTPHHTIPDLTALHHTAPHRVMSRSATPSPRRCRISYRAGAILHEFSAGEGDTEFAVIPAENFVNRQDRVQLVPR